MAPQKPPPGFNSSVEVTESLHRLHGIFGAGWNKATGGRQHRREKPFISTQQQEKCSLHGLHSCQLAADHLEAARYFFLQFSKICLERALFRVKNYISAH